MTVSLNSLDTLTNLLPPLREPAGTKQGIGRSLPRRTARRY
jgi:hypothetical protein